MKRLLVALHIHYHEQIDYFIDKLSNISGLEWDLKVTVTSKNNVTEEKLLKLKPDVEINYVENFGYDIMPFIKTIKSVDLRNYDYVLKLHTKRSVIKTHINKITLKGYSWRNALVDGILYNKNHFNKVIGILNDRADIGMISNILTHTETTFFSAKGRSSDELNRLNLHFTDNHVCLGTMFICKSETLSILQSEKITLEMFRDQIPISDTNSSIAHIYERILSLLPSTVGLKHIPIATSRKYNYLISFLSALEVPFNWAFCLDREGEDRRKFCRIMGFKFYLSKSA